MQTGSQLLWSFLKLYLSYVLSYYFCSYTVFSLNKLALHLKFSQVRHLIEPHTINCSDDGIERTVYELHISPQWCLGIPTLTIIILIPVLDRISVGWNSVQQDYSRDAFQYIEYFVCLSSWGMEISLFSITASCEYYISSILIIYMNTTTAYTSLHQTSAYVLRIMPQFWVPRSGWSFFTSYW